MTHRSKRLRRPTRGVLSLHLLMIALIVLPHPVVPATITVDGQTDDLTPGICDLVEAIENAEDDAATNADCAAGLGDDEIVLTLDVVLTESEDGDPDAGTGLPRIDGANGAIIVNGGNFAISRDAGASDKFRLFAISAVGKLTLNDVTVTGGLISDTNRDSTGGAILVNRGTLTLTNSTVSGNTVSGVDPYPYAYGGGIYTVGGTVNITDSTISNNRVEVINQSSGSLNFAFGGGISSCSDSCADSTSVIMISSSTLSGNTAEVIASNVSATSFAYGGAVYGAYGDVSITNSTLSGNDTTVSGVYLLAGAGGGAIQTLEADMVLQNTTISSNTSSYGGVPFGAALEFFPFNGTLKIYDSVIGNHPGVSNCYGVLATEDFGGNLADDLSCDTIPDTLTDLDAVLKDNGGPTETHALLATSTAVDAAGDCGLATDQRGVARPVGFCDSGSFELVGCQAADGDTFEVPDQVITGDVTFETCTSLTVADTDVTGTGHLTLRTAGTVELRDGFEVVGPDARLTVENDPGIVMPETE